MQLVKFHQTAVFVWMVSSSMDGTSDTFPRTCASAGAAGGGCSQRFGVLIQLLLGYFFFQPSTHHGRFTTMLQACSGGFPPKIVQRSGHCPHHRVVPEDGSSKIHDIRNEIRHEPLVSPGRNTTTTMAKDLGWWARQCRRHGDVIIHKARRVGPCRLLQSSMQSK